MREPLSNMQQDTEPLYDVYVQDDRITFVRRDEEEQIVDAGTPEQAEQTELSIIPLVFMGAHGLIALLSLALAAYLAFVPATATVYGLADRTPALALAHSLPALTMTQSQTISASGHVHTLATQARGLVTFYNGLTSPQTITAGTLMVGSDGQEIVTDQDASIPAGNLALASFGRATVWAHALNYGEAGNIKAGDIYGPCCRAFIQAVNAQFSGGHDARDYQIVTKDDIAAATSALLAQVQQNIQARLSALLSPGDTLVTPVPCTTHTASSKPAGAQAQQVMVTVTQSCTPAAYSLNELEHTLAVMVAGKTSGEAQAILARQGIREAGIKLPWLHDRLPANPFQIHVVVVYQPAAS